jgi:hypothetical protein
MPDEDLQAADESKPKRKTAAKKAAPAKKAAAKKTAKSATMTVVPKAVVFVECAHAETQLKCTPSSDVQVNSQHGLIRTA